MSKPTEKELAEFKKSLFFQGVTKQEDIDKAVAEKWPEISGGGPPTPPNPPSNPPAPSGDFDPQKAYGGMFGSFEEFQTAMSGLEALKAENQTMKQTLEQTQGRYNTLVGGIKNFSAPQIDEDAANYNKFIQATGIKDMGVFHRISKFDPEGMDQSNVESVVDAIALSMVLENPSLDRSYNDLINRIKRDHTETIPAVDEDSEPTTRIDSLGLQMKFGPASSKIKDLKSKYENFKPEGLEEGALDVDQWLSERESNAKALAEKWTPVINSFVDNTKEVSAWGGDNPYSVQLPEGGLKPFADALLNSAVSSGKEPSEESLKAIAQNAGVLYLANNVEAVAKSYAADLLKQNDIELENPTLIKRSPGTPDTPPEKTGAQKAQEFIRQGTHFVEKTA